MSNILLIWCRINLEVEARQWKYEILACVCYAYYSECVDLKKCEK